MTAVFYGGCGVERCAECWPLFDEQNREIPDTTTQEGVNRYLAGESCSR